jgi:quercetin dioxygenase-like cupin family protein
MRVAIFKWNFHFKILVMNKIVVRKEEALKKVFKGVSLDSLAVGERSMVTKMNYVKGNFATTHQHPHEQCGYVISGEYRLKVEMEQPIDVVLHAGDSYAIPGNTPHSFEVLEGGEVVDVFTPHREDYL